LVRTKIGAPVRKKALTRSLKKAQDLALRSNVELQVAEMSKKC
jgi:hypothetical protein